MPQHDPVKYLYDIDAPASRIMRFVSGKTFSEYTSDEMLKSATERQFEIIGEALKQLLDRYPEYSSTISYASRIISFRNKLIHGYSGISDEVVWGIIQTNLPTLQSEINRLLRRFD